MIDSSLFTLFGFVVFLFIELYMLVEGGRASRGEEEGEEGREEGSVMLLSRKARQEGSELRGRGREFAACLAFFFEEEEEEEEAELRLSGLGDTFFSLVLLCNFLLLLMLLVFSVCVLLVVIVSSSYSSCVPPFCLSKLKNQ